VAPSLGRMSLRSTNALLAAFNARLGVWLPNPRFEHDRRSTPRLVNMFKEIFGLYDEDEPNLYTTDGGHWENLGLVELLRKECDRIVCLDASADPPGSYTTLRQAMQLARLECKATIDVSDETWEVLTPDDHGVARKNYGLATVSYDSGATGQILFIKAAVAAGTSLPVLRYASADRAFPNYSTGDQFLSDGELEHLMQLGYESVNAALADHDQFAAEALLGSVAESSGGSR
ncbi:MAG: hypothetical protein ACR2QK_24360, partial [Acidimicrobiales bacterium]